MRIFLRSIAFTALLLLWSPLVVSLCQEVCVCHDGQVICRNAALTSVPSDLNDDTVDLDLSFNNITIVGNNDFKNVLRLKTLTLSDDEIEILEPDVFHGLHELEQIDLHNNKLADIHPSLFQDNLNLKILDLSGNGISEFKSDFSFNAELKFLNLSGNFLNFGVTSTLSSLAPLETLDISDNQIETLNEDFLSEMVNLVFLDISGNPQLEYDCRLKTLRTICSSKNITCIVDDDQSWRMVDNLNCESEVPESLPLTEEFMELNETTEENGVTVEIESGSGMEPTEISREGSGSDDVLVEVAPGDDWTLIAIVVGSVCGVVILVIVAVICICRRQRAQEEESGNLSRTNSIGYINQTDEFNSSYNNSRTSSARNNNNRVHNHYDRVIPSETNRNVIQFQVGDNVSAEVVRVPSFKTRGVATPLNLPQEVSPEETGLIIENTSHSNQTSLSSLTRLNPANSYEQNTTVRVGSIKKHKKPVDVTNPGARITVPEVRSVYNGQRHVAQ